MAHPIMFDDTDPHLVHLRQICLAMPGAAEKISHGRPCFYTKKIFAVYGAVAKGGPPSKRYDRSVLILPQPDEAPAMLADRRFFVPAYWGPSGWLGLDFTSAPVDWDEVAELLLDSFRLTAPASIASQHPVGPEENRPDLEV